MQHLGCRVEGGYTSNLLVHLIQGIFLNYNVLRSLGTTDNSSTSAVL